MKEFCDKFTMTNKNLEDEFGRPKVGEPVALYWVMGYFAAGRGAKSEDCPFKSSLDSYVYWQRGHRAKIEGDKYMVIGKK